LIALIWKKITGKKKQKAEKEKPVKPIYLLAK